MQSKEDRMDEAKELF